MKKILFASDLDNTLIHSYQKKSESDICTEYYQEREQSFISPEAAALFRNVIKQKNICFLPVTTRTIAQYQRIFFPDNFRPEFALAANGCILLKQDVPEQEWLAESQEKILADIPEFQRLEKIFLKDHRFRHVAFADSMFLACACETAQTAELCLKEYTVLTSLPGFRTGRKLYFFSPGSDKGTALKKFAAFWQPDIIIAAGDSEIDLPMLKQADIAVFRESQTDFAAYVLKFVLNTAL